VQFIVYDNDKMAFEHSPEPTSDTIIDYGILNGFHKVVVNAWDSKGNLYQGKVSFTIIGDGFQRSCDIPATPGVNSCVPPPGTVFSVFVPLSASAKGQFPITAMSLYVDGKFQGTTVADQIGVTQAVGTQENHNITWVAWDSVGNVYTDSKTIRPAYTYSYAYCDPGGGGPCFAGFDDSTMPQPNSYLPNSFRLQATIRDNPLPITAIKAYIDKTLVATSTGPVMDFPVENGPNGTHILTFQAWDSSGVIYRIQFNININVPH
jgi:hypothetical protein